MFSRSLPQWKRSTTNKSPSFFQNFDPQNRSKNWFHGAKALRVYISFRYVLLFFFYLLVVSGIDKWGRGWKAGCPVTESSHPRLSCDGSSTCPNLHAGGQRSREWRYLLRSSSRPQRISINAIKVSVTNDLRIISRASWLSCFILSFKTQIGDKSYKVFFQIIEKAYFCGHFGQKTLFILAVRCT